MKELAEKVGPRPSFLQLAAALWGAEEELAKQRVKKYKKRQRDILLALYHLGGTASTRQIAERLGLHVNGVAQSLGALDCVEDLGGRAGDRQWRLKQ